MFNLAHVILKNPNDKVKVRSRQSGTCLFVYLSPILSDCHLVLPHPDSSRP